MNAVEGNHVTITYRHGKIGDEFKPATIDIPCAKGNYVESVAAYFLESGNPKPALMTGKDFSSRVNSAYFTAALGTDSGQTVDIDPDEYYKIISVEPHKA